MSKTTHEAGEELGRALRNLVEVFGRETGLTAFLTRVVKWMGRRLER